MTGKSNAVFTIAVSVVLNAMPLYAQKDYGVHDPSTIVKEKGRYYTFYTSNGVEYAYSTDLCTWRRGGAVFSSGFPSWITGYVSGFGGHFWAPEVFFMNDRWHVYYSCSSFGSRRSAIGLATTASLEIPEWQDRGMVVSTNDASNHNAIDPAILRHDNRIWLVYGSFWSGIVITELDSTTGKPIDKSDLHYVANSDPEAACIIHHDDHYYLFFNRGKCCNGVNSTYYINVGRSSSPTGPYLDRSGKKTSSGGGTVILETQGRFIGPGHFGFFSENGSEYMSYHYYDADRNGTSKLKISTLSWQDGWPVVNTGFDPCDPPVPVTNNAGANHGPDIKVTSAGGRISFYLKKESFLRIRIFTVSGRTVPATVSGGFKAGVNSLSLDPFVAAGSGVYFVLFETGGTSAICKKFIDTGR